MESTITNFIKLHNNIGAKVSCPTCNIGTTISSPTYLEMTVCILENLLFSSFLSVGVFLIFLEDEEGLLYVPKK